MKPKPTPHLVIFLCLFLLHCGLKERSPFQFKENKQGLELSENGSAVLFYQRTPKSLEGKYQRNNYVHPLFSLDGDTLTEDFPADHLHHRGIFWAWHQLYAGEQNLGDGWELKDFTVDIVKLDTVTEADKAYIQIMAFWQTPPFGSNDSYIEENTTITVHRSAKELRKIDFEIVLLALRPDMRIGGSDDAKGYGGFSARIKMPDSLIFTSEAGRVMPHNLQITAGPWMDFSAPYGKNNSISGLTLLCHPNSPNFPQPWILRQKGSMQNIVYPGRTPVVLSQTTATRLRYRVILHRGAADRNKILEWQREYAETTMQRK